MGRFSIWSLKGSHICPMTFFVKTVWGRCKEQLRYVYPPSPSRHSDMSWVFHASEPWPIVIGQIANPPPNLKLVCASQNQSMWCMWQFYTNAWTICVKKIFKAYKQITKRKDILTINTWKQKKQIRQKQSLVHKVPSGVAILSHVSDVAAIVHPQKM